MRARPSSGFTVIEAIVTVAVLGIAATVALPEFTNLLASRRVASSADDLFATLYYARSEAIRQNKTVVVQAIGGDWSNGWEVTDPGHPGTFLLQRARTRLVVAEQSVDAAAVSYLPSGRLPGGVAPSFSVCDSDNRAKKRLVTVDLSGLPSVKAAGTCP